MKIIDDFCFGCILLMGLLRTDVLGICVMIKPLHPGAMRLASFMTAINVLVASGFSITGVVRPELKLPADHVSTEASFIFALYAAARTLALCLAVLVAIYKRAAPALLVLGTLAGVVQLLDAGIGFIQHDPAKIFGPLVFAVLQFLVMLNLSRSIRKQSENASLHPAAAR
jgi:hypothetical protein